MHTITIDGTEYVPVTEAPEPTPWKLVVLQRGWVFVGRYSLDPASQIVTLTDSRNIRVWGTTRGLGELAESGPTASTKLDHTGVVTFHLLTQVLAIDTEVTTW